MKKQLLIFGLLMSFGAPLCAMDIPALSSEVEYAVDYEVAAYFFARLGIDQQGSRPFDGILVSRVMDGYLVSRVMNDGSELQKNLIQSLLGVLKGLKSSGCMPTNVSRNDVMFMEEIVKYFEEKFPGLGPEQSQELTYKNGYIGDRQDTFTNRKQLEDLLNNLQSTFLLRNKRILIGGAGVIGVMAVAYGVYRYVKNKHAHDEKTIFELWFDRGKAAYQKWCERAVPMISMKPPTIGA